MDVAPIGEPASLFWDYGDGKDRPFFVRRARAAAGQSPATRTRAVRMQQREHGRPWNRCHIAEA